MKLTIAFITGRGHRAMLGWVQRSLMEQARPDDEIHLIVVNARHQHEEAEFQKAFLKHWGFPAPDRYVDMKGFDMPPFRTNRWMSPMPTPWQGPARTTREDWWAMSNARNTALVLCETEWIAFLDDRCALGPGWLDAVRRAMGAQPDTPYRQPPYIVCGGYEKRHGMEGPGGELLEGTRVALDNRYEATGGERHVNCGGQWLYGCSFALPLDWSLSVNGFEEGCDGLSAEDYIFGMHLANANYPLVYDPTMWVIQDRSPGHENTYRREDKGVSPYDKSHAALERFGKGRHTLFTRNLLEERSYYRQHHSFRPFDSTGFLDWFDGEPVDEQYPRDRAAPRMATRCRECDHHHLQEHPCYCGCERPT